MFKAILSKLKNPASSELADWMKTNDRGERFSRLKANIERGLISCFERKMNIKNLYIVVSSNGTLGFSSRKISPNRNPLIASLALEEISGIEQYINSYHKQKTNQGNFLVFHNETSNLITSNILNATNSYFATQP